MLHKIIYGWKPSLTLIGGLLVALAVSLGLSEARYQAAPQALGPEAIIIEADALISGFNLLTDVKVANDGRFFAAQKTGEIRIGLGDGSILGLPFLDLSGLVGSAGELGLSSIALHPQFDSNGRFYVSYDTPDLKTRIVRYNVSQDDENKADPASAQLILTVNQPANNHNGAGMAFGPDGYLYIGLGDGGSSNDPENNAQNGQTLLGSILRLDVDGSAPYAIPADNPFVSNQSVKDEIWDMGLRNPWRFSFDRQNGDLYIGDVGQQSWEEIDYELAGTGGLNYGWRCYEGYLPHITEGCGDPSLYEPPIFVLARNKPPCAFVGGYVYRGNDSLPIDGHYLFADYCSGTIWSLVNQADQWQIAGKGSTPQGFVTTFSEGSDGTLYVADFSKIYKISARSISTTQRALLPIIRG